MLAQVSHKELENIIKTECYGISSFTLTEWQEKYSLAYGNLFQECLVSEYFTYDTDSRDESNTIRYLNSQLRLERPELPPASKADENEIDKEWRIPLVPELGYALAYMMAAYEYGRAEPHRLQLRKQSFEYINQYERNQLIREQGVARISKVDIRKALQGDIRRSE